MPDSGDAEDCVSTSTNVGPKITRLAGKNSRPVKPIVIYGGENKKDVDIFSYATEISQASRIFLCLQLYEKLGAENQ